jgi:nitroreductase
MENVAGLLASAKQKQTHTPLILRLNNHSDKAIFKALIKEGKVSFVHDEMYGQLQEFVKSKNPAIKIKKEDYPALVEAHLAGTDINEYGVWVYYPWNQELVHLLDEEEFIEVRTNRNRYKITKEEQDLLKTKKIGIVGLSVGQSIALTIAMERTCGELRLADFDTAELSNLNRIRTGVRNLGINKTIIAAREIAEIDPYLNIKIFNDGLHAGNMDDFFTGDGKLDLFVEVCDGLDVKIESRFKARELGIPVVMDTNDRGMLDVERFDLEPQRAILHGLADGLDPHNIKDLTNEEKIPYILRMIGADTISTRLKASMLEVEQSINTWPQLASSVTLGGALTTDICRRILLDQYHESGRYYIDLEDLVKDAEKKIDEEVHTANPYLPIEQSAIKRVADEYFTNAKAADYKISESDLNTIVDAAIAAPSAGNNQPWKWFFSKNILFLFHDKYRSWSWGDYYEMGSHMSLGAALENVHLQSAALNLKDDIELFPLENEPGLIAAIRFSAAGTLADAATINTARHLYTRHTNRKLGKRQKLNADFYLQLQQLVGKFDNVNFYFTEDENELAELAEIIAECDKVRLLNKLGHEEFYHELRWNRDEAEKTKDGVEVASVDITQSEIAGFKVAGDWKAIELLAGWDKGDAFKKMSLKAVKSASAIIVFTIPEFTHAQLINAGRAVQNAWIFANQQGVSVHPMLSPAFFFNRLIHGHGEELGNNVADKLSLLRKRFLKIFPLISGNNGDQREVFLMKVAIGGDLGIKSLRKDKIDLFCADNL